MKKISEAQKKEKESWCVLCCVVFVCSGELKYFRRENLRTGCYWLLEIGISCTWELEYVLHVIDNWAA